MTQIRMYRGYTEAECWDIALRRISNSFAFKAYIASKCKKCPRDVVVGCDESRDPVTGETRLEFGISVEKVEWDVPTYESPEDMVTEAAIEYFELYEPELYKTMEPTFHR